ncbi:primase-like DNA-binding domain-containing protein [Bacillus thuringiensis]
MIQQFVEENIERDRKSFETKEVLYARYLQFCQHNNVQPLTRIKFGKKLDELNAGVKHSRMKNYVHESGRWGVKLLPCKY